MVEGAANKCAKYLLFVFNVLFVVSNVRCMLSVVYYTVVCKMILTSYCLSDYRWTYRYSMYMTI